ncbi:MAG: hypothetical protein WDZ35_06385 [Crocinitomicaceae bacterium]
MKYKGIPFLVFIFLLNTAISQTAHEGFMNSKITTNVSGDYNHWVHGDNSIVAETANDLNSWSYSYMGLEGSLETATADDFSAWKVKDLDITITAEDPTFKQWQIVSEGKSVTLSTSNWNSWAITGDLVSGISTTVTDNFSEWEIQGGDWTTFSPNYRASIIFVSVISSTILKDLSK